MHVKLEAVLWEMENGLDHEFVCVEDIDVIEKAERQKKLKIE